MLKFYSDLFASETDYEIVREGDRGLRKADLKPKDGCGKIIGTVAVCVKDDPDMKEPPGTYFLKKEFHVWHLF
jgi:hypothetical protein